METKNTKKQIVRKSTAAKTIQQIQLQSLSHGAQMEQKQRPHAHGGAPASTMLTCADRNAGCMCVRAAPLPALRTSAANLVAPRFIGGFSFPPDPDLKKEVMKTCCRCFKVESKN